LDRRWIGSLKYSNLPTIVVASKENFTDGATQGRCIDTSYALSWSILWRVFGVACYGKLSWYCQTSMVLGIVNIQASRKSRVRAFKLDVKYVCATQSTTLPLSHVSSEKHGRTWSITCLFPKVVCFHSLSFFKSQNPLVVVVLHPSITFSFLKFLSHSKYQSWILRS